MYIQDPGTLEFRCHDYVRCCQCFRMYLYRLDFQEDVNEHLWKLSGLSGQTSQLDSTASLYNLQKKERYLDVNNCSRTEKEFRH